MTKKEVEKLVLRNLWRCMGLKRADLMTCLSIAVINLDSKSFILQVQLKSVLGLLRKDQLHPRQLAKFILNLRKSLSVLRFVR